MDTTATDDGLTHSACAECRRAKTKCDRRIPCNHCIRKGCANLCPSGALSAWYKRKGTRAPAPPEAQSSVGQSDYSDRYLRRIKDLEQALEISHSTHSSTTHPLLETHLRVQPEAAQTPDEEREDIGPFLGRAKWLDANSVRSWFTGDQFGDERQSVNELINISQISLPTLPIAVANSGGVNLEQILPSIDIIREMIKAYFTKGILGFIVVPEPLVEENILSKPINQLDSPRFAQLLLLMALAIQHVPTAPQEWGQSHQWYELALKVMPMEDIFVNPSIESVEALALKFTYELRAASPDAYERAWGTLGVCLRLAQAAHLHRDPKRWPFNHAEAQRRRRVFWELWTSDLHLALITGRPPAVNFQHFDTEMPFDTIESLGIEPAYFRIKHQMMQSVVIDIINCISTTPTPSTYATILTLDERLRGLRIPNKLKNAHDPCQVVDLQEYSSPIVRLQEHSLYQIRLYLYILMHRPFFAKAILEAISISNNTSGEHLMRSAYSKSVLKLYESVKNIVFHLQWMKDHEIWTLQEFQPWSLHATSCLVICAALLINAPRANISLDALPIFDQITLLLLQGDGRQQMYPEKLFPIVSRLWYAAHTSMERARGPIQPRQHTAILDNMLRPYHQAVGTQQDASSTAEGLTGMPNEGAAAQPMSMEAVFQPGASPGTPTSREYLDAFSQLSQQLWANSLPPVSTAAQAPLPFPEHSQGTTTTMSFNDYLRIHTRTTFNEPLGTRDVSSAFGGMSLGESRSPAHSRQQSIQENYASGIAASSTHDDPMLSEPGRGQLRDNVLLEMEDPWMAFLTQ